MTAATLRALAVGGSVAALLAACSLFSSLDGLAGAPMDDGGASGDARSGAACDAQGCASFHPSGAVTPADLEAAGASAITLVDAVTIHTDTGAIDRTTPGDVRPAGIGLQGGIGFRVNGGVAIFTFASLTVNALALHVVGPNAVALVSADKIVLNGGVLDAQGTCLDGGAGPGASGPGQGTGAGGVGSVDGPATGGGGGGYGGGGGIGGLDAASPLLPGAAGASWGIASLVPLAGGSGGGNRNTFAGPVGGGGAGGGAVQLVAASQIFVAGSINASGCGGVGGECGGCPGGGGGSGGAILLEARDVVVSGTLAANGGGGGAGNGADGANGALGATLAAGGSGDGHGGAGGADRTPNGAPGTCGVYNCGGGGGGVGRIRINTLSGSAAITGTLSPSLTAPDAGSAFATQGTIDIH